MKILFAIKGLYEAKGGAERVICQISSALAERGHDVSLISFDEPGKPAFYNLSDKVNRIGLGLGPIDRKTNLLKFIKRINKLRKVIKRESADIIIPFMHSMYVPVTIATLGIKIRVIGSEHSTPENYVGKFIEYSSLLAVMLTMECCTVVSDKVLMQFPKFIRHKLVPITNPVEFPKKEGRTELSGNNLILNVGSLTPQKDQKVLIEGFAQLKEEFVDWKLKIIGDGDLEQNLKEQVKELNIADRVLFLKGTNKIEDEYLGADVFVMSSRYESFGLVTAEAMACGLPVVGFEDCSGTNELIADGINGVLVSGEPRATRLAKGIEKLIDDKMLYRRISEKGVQSVAKFNLSNVVEVWEKMINKD